MNCCDNQEFTKQDMCMIKGMAILGMVALHLFCRTDNLPYEVLLYWRGIPIVYYIGLFGDMCVPIYCFCSGYAHYLLCEKNREEFIKKKKIKLIAFLENYWIICLGICLLSFAFGKGEVIPGSFSQILGNFFLYDISYNGAWWFVLTYVFLLLLSPLFFHMVRKWNGILLFMGSGIVYFLSYLFRFQIYVNISQGLINWVFQQGILLGTSLFPYILGMLFRKYRLQSRVSLMIKGRKVSHLIPGILFIFHGVIQSAIVAPITAIGMIIWFQMTEKSKGFEKIFIFLGRHSTNIWLLHMFFYMKPFENMVFSARYPLFVYIYMMVICIAISMFINYILVKQKCKWRR